MYTLVKLSYISTKPSGYQNIHFVLCPYFVQNKYVPHTNIVRPIVDQQHPLGGGAQFWNLCPSNS
jgi:hypothetical protein